MKIKFYFDNFLFAESETVAGALGVESAERVGGSRALAVSKADSAVLGRCDSRTESRHSARTGVATANSGARAASRIHKRAIRTKWTERTLRCCQLN
jgi:hypothetical protein